jgi:hypothetical protein
LANALGLNGESRAALEIAQGVRQWLERKYAGKGGPFLDGAIFIESSLRNNLGQFQHALDALNGISVKGLEAAQPEIDGVVRLDLEKGRSLIGLGRTDEGRMLMVAAISRVKPGSMEPGRIKLYRQCLEASTANACRL